MIAPPGVFDRREILPAAFCRRATLDVARDLLGKRLAVVARGRVALGRIVEVEAYHERDDAASHSHGGPTPRNAVMYRPGGALYVYFTYGMHHCMNVVTEEAGVGAAVLVRAVEPLDGIALMRRRRGARVADRALANGPAKCCEAFGVTLRDNGASLAGPRVFLLDGAPVPDAAVGRSERIGITRSRELIWRFFERDSPFLSR